MLVELCCLAALLCGPMFGGELRTGLYGVVKPHMEWLSTTRRWNYFINRNITIAGSLPVQPKRNARKQSRHISNEAEGTVWPDQDVTAVNLLPVFSCCCCAAGCSALRWGGLHEQADEGGVINEETCLEQGSI